MRIFPISDLHLERRTLPLPAIAADFDVLVFSGDGHEGEPSRTVEIIAELAGGRPAVIVPGNHDYYRRNHADPRTMRDLLEEMNRAALLINEEAGRDLINILAGSRIVEIDDVVFVGATLWGDWAISGRWRPDVPPARAAAYAATHAMRMSTIPREFSGSIQNADGEWGPYQTVGAHAVDRARILQGLIEAADRPTVAVTHAPPLAEAADLYRDSPIPWWAPGFYASDFLREMPPELQPSIWIAGHVHRGYDMTYGRTRLISNPLEGPNFRPDLVIEIDVPEPEPYVADPLPEERTTGRNIGGTPHASYANLGLASGEDLDDLLDRPPCP